ncbi:hypothetical protein GCM10022215_21170 [Nocardioides fonticola]|uniref:Uncharacterized protein n=1 Tax=Nocardioides fonticola TaxID=450363 RepID=A0ABP7XIP3_9ACTN
MTVGAPVSASVSLASPVDALAVAWRWSRVVDGVATPIEGATTGSYTPVAGDVGVVLRATADLTAPRYVSGSASAETAPVSAAGLPAVRVVLSGKPRVGKVLRGVLAGAPSANELPGLTVTWTWQRLSSRGTVRTVPGLPGLPGMRALTRADRGKRLRVTAVVAAPGYVPVTVTTVSGVVGKGRIPRPRVRLVQDGVVLVARVAGLRALAGKVPGLAVSYRWRDNAGHGIGDGRRLVIPPGYAGRIRVLVRLRAPGYVTRLVSRSVPVDRR